MRVSSFLAVVGVFGLCGLGASVASLGGCGGAGSTPGISVSTTRDLGGYVVTSQSGAPDAATGGVDSGSVGDTGGGTVDAGSGNTGGTSCGSVTQAGDCNGSTLEYCDPTTGLQTEDCSSQGLTCAVSSGMADCVASSGSSGGSCGSVTTDGQCNGNTLEYCSSSGTLTTKDCTTSGKTCTVETSGYAECK